MRPYQYRISLHIVHSSKDLADVQRQLSVIEGCEPYLLQKVGEERKTPKGQPLPGVYRESRCSLRCNGDKLQDSVHKPLTDALEEIAGALRPFKNTFDDIMATGGRAYFFVGWFIDANSESWLNSSLLNALGDLGIGLTFDVYPSEEQVDIFWDKYLQVETALKVILQKYDMRGVLQNPNLNQAEYEDAYSGVIEGIIPYIRYERDRNQFCAKLRQLLEYYDQKNGTKDLPIDQEAYFKLTDDILSAIVWPQKTT
jgi:hypothetical protein